MARFIFIATVLVALCYTSQAVPIERNGGLNDIKNKIREILDKKFNPQEGAEAAYLGRQYGLVKLLGSVTNLVGSTTGLAQGIVSETLDTAARILDAVSDSLNSANPKKIREGAPEEPAVAALNLNSLRERLDELKKKAEEMGKDAKEKITEGVSEGKKIVEDKTKKVGDAIDNIEKEIIQGVGDLAGKGRDKINEIQDELNKIVG